jgi:dTMP kinase
MWIDFEGIDGSGKTSLASRVAARLRASGREVVEGRSAIAARIREVTREAELFRLAPETELLLNIAREAQNVAEIVRPALARGAIVITDRTVYSHVAVAAAVRGLSRSAADAVAEFAVKGLRPDRVLLIDVDPDVARLRKRIRKIRERRLRDSSRKGLLGEAFARGARSAFLEMARRDPARWTVLDNSFGTLEEAEAALTACLAGGSPPSRRAPSFDPGDSPGELIRRFFAVARDLAGRDPASAAVTVGGMDHPTGHSIRQIAPFDVAAYSAAGVDAEPAWGLRQKLAGPEPYYTARGLAGFGDDERAWALRDQLDAAAPGQVLHSLSRTASPRAHDARRRLFEQAPDEAVLSLKGIDDADSWSLRDRARGGAELAESLARLGGDRAWAVRDGLRAQFPLSVLKGVRGLDDPKAWELRWEALDAAPKAVLATLEGMDGPRAAELRLKLRERCPEETAESLSGLDTPEARRARLELADAAPAGVIRSLRGLPGEELVWDIVRKHGTRIRVAREAVKFYRRSAP